MDAARLMLLYTPGLLPDAAAAERALLAALPWVDVVQVRVKGSARELHDGARRVLELTAGADVLVTVNDRADVAAVLEADGVAGLHLGEDDCPPREARDVVGPRLLVGLSTHDARAVARAEDEPVDYLGFGPIHPTPTKGYARGLGAEAAWVAARVAAHPLFPIGGIDVANAAELAPVGRAAVSAAILTAPDPAAAARAIRAALVADEP